MEDATVEAEMKICEESLTKRNEKAKAKVMFATTEASAKSMA